MGMEHNLSEEEKAAIIQNHEKFQHQSTNSVRKGGLRTLPFIIVNESFERIASYGLLPNMILYLVNGYNMEAASASIIISLWGAASSFMAIFGAFLSDSYLGRFRVIAFGTLLSFFGVTLLWLTSVFPWMKPSPCLQSGQSCESATPLQYLVLYSSFSLMSIGAGCVRPCSMAFGTDQLSSKENPDNGRVLDSFFNWYYISVGLSGLIAVTVVVYIQDQFGWRIGFAVPASLMALSFITFFLGSPLYVHVKASESLLIVLIQVPVAAYHKRKISLPLPYAVEHYFHGNGSNIQTLSENLRCLNKACLIVDAERELNPDGSAKDPWRLSTVEQVEGVKAIMRLLLWVSTGIMMLVLLTNPYSTLQAKVMDRHITSGFEIPAGSFGTFAILALTFSGGFYDRVVVPLLAKYCGMPHGLSPKVRMGLGLLLSCIGMIISGAVESIRRKMAIDNGMEEDPNAVVDMSAMWLAPQFVLLGLAETFNVVGQFELYYTLLPKSMASVPMTIYILGTAMSSLVSGFLVDVVDSFSTAGGNESWLSQNLNKGHLDYYYWMLAFVGFVNFLYFLICCRVCECSGGSDSRKLNDVEEVDSDYRALPSA